MEKSTQADRLSRWLPWLAVAALLLVVALLWQPLAVLWTERDVAALQAAVAELGVLAPFGFLVLSVIQIVGAPIPGYPIQILGGALFGTLIGGLYGVLGMLAGGLLSAWLVRRLGRPFLERQVSPEALARYSRLTHLESVWVWVVILLAPTGDVPYYFAGLSRVRLSTLALAILISRGPFTFIVAWAGANALQVPPFLFWLILGLILVVVLLGYLGRAKIGGWVDQHLLHWLE